MLKRILSIPDRMAAKAMDRPLDRRGFLREIVISALAALSMPCITLMLFSGYFSGGSAEFVAFGFALALAALLPGYASLRLNAATLARERTVIGPAEQQVYPPWQGPIMLRRFMSRGSIRSRVLAQFPVVLGMAMMVALLHWLSRDNNLLPFLVPLVLCIVVQMVIAARLLR